MFGVVFSLGQTSTEWSATRSVVDAILDAALAWVSVYLVAA